MNNQNQSDVDSLTQGNYTVDIGAFISRGWELCQSNLGAFIGFTLLTAIIGFVLGLIPLVGTIASAIIGGPLNAGGLIVALKTAKQQPVQFGDFFKGFQNAYFVPLLLTSIVIGLLIGLFFIPMGIAIALIDPSSQQAPNPTLLGVLIVSMLIGLAGALYLGVSYFFAIPLVIGRRMEFWPAMETSRKIVGRKWVSFFGFALVLGLINFAGALLCGLGLLITAPLSTCAIAAAYERIVGLPNFDPSQA
jgi:hypothetical protein